MYTELKGNVVLITGGGTGIGRETALAFAREGCHVAICGRRKEKLDEVVRQGRELGFNIFSKTADVTDRESISAFARETADHFGGIDIWVNNAGASMGASLLACSDEDWDRMMDVNLKSVWTGCQVALPYLKYKESASIINFSSFTAYVPNAKSGLYSLAKGAVKPLTRILAAELAPYNIRVNCVAPGFIMTDLLMTNNSERIKNNRAEMLKDVALRQFGKPETVAKSVVFLASNANQYITGSCLLIGGGKLLVQDTQNAWTAAEQMRFESEV